MDELIYAYMGISTLGIVISGLSLSISITNGKELSDRKSRVVANNATDKRGSARVLKKRRTRASISLEDREVIKLLASEGVSHKEISKLKGVAVSTVSKISREPGKNAQQARLLN